MEKLLLKPGEVTELLGISKSHIYELLATGEMPSVRIGRCVRVPVASLNKWIEVNLRGGVGEAAGGGKDGGGGENGGGGNRPAVHLG